MREKTTRKIQRTPEKRRETTKRVKTFFRSDIFRASQAYVQGRISGVNRTNFRSLVSEEVRSKLNSLLEEGISGRELEKRLQDIKFEHGEKAAKAELYLNHKKEEELLDFQWKLLERLIGLRKSLQRLFNGLNPSKKKFVELVLDSWSKLDEEWREKVDELVRLRRLGGATVLQEFTRSPDFRKKEEDFTRKVQKFDAKIKRLLERNTIPVIDEFLHFLLQEKMLKKQYYGNKTRITWLLAERSKLE